MRPIRAAGREERLDRLFYALSDATRRRILGALVIRPSKVTDLARPFAISLPAISKHIKVLERAGLVRRSVDGRIHRCRLAAEPLRAVEVWLDPFRAYWDVRLGDLARSLARARTGDAPGGTEPLKARRDSPAADRRPPIVTKRPHRKPSRSTKQHHQRVRQRRVAARRRRVRLSKG